MRVAAAIGRAAHRGEELLRDMADHEIAHYLKRHEPEFHQACHDALAEAIAEVRRLMSR